MTGREDIFRLGEKPARAARTVFAYSVMLFGIAASIAILPAMIWVFATRGLQ